MEDYIIWTIICVVIMGAPIYFANWLTKGMFLKLMKVFGSRGQLLLVEVIHPIQNYYVVGKHIDGYLLVKDHTCIGKDKHKVKRIAMEQDFVYRSWGVNCVRYDEIKNCLSKPDFKGISGFDALKQENLLIRALTDPKNNKEKQYQMIMILLLVITLLAVGYLVYANNVLSEQVLLLLKNSNQLVGEIPVIQ